MSFSKIVHHVAVTSLVFASTVFVASAAISQSDLANEAKRKVNLAGRQRMLSQRMSKASCFLLTGVETDFHQQMLVGASDLFALTHDALRFGNTELGLSEEKIPDVTEALAVVDTRWLAYSPLVQGIISGNEVSKDSLVELNAKGLALLADMNAVVTTTATSYGKSLPDLPLILALTIDFAGRQRMLTQKVSKELCLVSAGINTEANRATMTETLEYFNLTLLGLINGYPGAIIAATNDDILNKSKEVESLWAQPN